MAELTEAQKKKRDEIAEALKADPKFEPLPGRTKEESAFAVATSQVQEGNPHHSLDEFSKSKLLSFASELEFSGDPVLQSLGMRLSLAVNRGDMKKAKSVLRDLRDVAENTEAAEFAVPLIKDFEEIVSEEGNGNG